MNEKRYCLRCGKEIDLTEKYACKRKYCKVCGPIHELEAKRERANSDYTKQKKAEYRAKARANKALAKINKNLEPKQTLSEILKQANEKNMSYGKYVEALERGDFN